MGDRSSSHVTAQGIEDSRHAYHSIDCNISRVLSISLRALETKLLRTLLDPLNRRLHLPDLLQTNLEVKFLFQFRILSEMFIAILVTWRFPIWLC